MGKYALIIEVLVILPVNPVKGFVANLFEGHHDKRQSKIVWKIFMEKNLLKTSWSCR